MIGFVILVGLRESLKATEGLVWFAGEAVQESSLLVASVTGGYLSGIDSAKSVFSYCSV